MSQNCEVSKPTVPDETSPDPNVDKIAARLNDGLKTCRSMVSNYKALLEAEQKAAESPTEADQASLADRQSTSTRTIVPLTKT